MSRLIGAGRAIEFILRSRIVDPDTALSLGLIHELADDARRAMQAYVDLPFDRRREWLEHGAYPKYSGR